MARLATLPLRLAPVALQGSPMGALAFCNPGSLWR